MIHLNDKLWSIHQLCVLRVLNEKVTILDCHEKISIELAEVKSQQAVLCRNKYQAELNPETKIITTSHNFVVTLIKENGSGILSRLFTTLSQHKELKMEEKLCCDKRQLCHNTKFRVIIERQEDFVTIEKFYVTANTT